VYSIDILKIFGLTMEIIETQITPMILKELESQILALTPADRAEVIQLLIQTLPNGSQVIKKTPGVCGGDACVGNSRIPVWSLVHDRQLGMSDAQILEAFPDLTAADLVNAWAYAEAYSTEIETAIQENEAAMLEAG
jgi:uncharacterized protein (DUF433 family)